MEENETYKLSEITVDADELRKAREELDELVGSFFAFYRRLEKLINEGTVTIKHASNEKNTIEETRNRFDTRRS